MLSCERSYLCWTLLNPLPGMHGTLPGTHLMVCGSTRLISCRTVLVSVCVFVPGFVLGAVVPARGSMHFPHL
jgi:hypothetical protein